MDFARDALQDGFHVGRNCFRNGLHLWKVDVIQALQLLQLETNGWSSRTQRLSARMSGLHHGHMQTAPGADTGPVNLFSFDQYAVRGRDGGLASVTVGTVVHFVSRRRCRRKVRRCDRRSSCHGNPVLGLYTAHHGAVVTGLLRWRGHHCMYTHVRANTQRAHTLRSESSHGGRRGSSHAGYWPSRDHLLRGHLCAADQWASKAYAMCWTWLHVYPSGLPVSGCAPRQLGQVATTQFRLRAEQVMIR